MSADDTFANQPRAAGESLARFMERRGLRVFEGAGVLWAQYRGSIFISLPYQLRLDPDRDELGEAMRAARIGAVRYPTLSRGGWADGLYCCSPRGYSLERVDRKHRAQVKRGLEMCDLRVIGADDLGAQGFELNLQTMARQGRFDAAFGKARRWQALVRAIRDTPGVTVFGAYLGGRLSSYVVSCRDGTWLHLLYKMSRTEDLVHRTNYALDYWVLSQASKDPSIEAVSSGFTGLVRGGNAQSLQHYKQNVGYAVVPLQVAVQLHPVLTRLLANRVVIRVAAGASRLRPRSRRLAVAVEVLEGARSSPTSPPSTASEPSAGPAAVVGRRTAIAFATPPVRIEEVAKPAPPPRRRGMRGQRSIPSTDAPKKQG